MSRTTTPLMILADQDGKPIKGVTKSTSMAEAQEKAERLGPGTYKVIRPNATIKVCKAKK